MHYNEFVETPPASVDKFGQEDYNFYDSFISAFLRCLIFPDFSRGNDSVPAVTVKDRECIYNIF